MLRERALRWALGAGLLIPVGCFDSRAADTTPPVVITAEAKKEAEEIYAARCASCHGARGLGDGPKSAALRPQPRNLADKMWHSNVTDRYIETIIASGGAAVGKSPLMLPNRDLATRPMVLAALRAYVRSFAN